MPKARGWDVCACCGALIPTGKRFDRYAGRPWLPEHLKTYKAKRRLVTR